ncbi:MAG: NAD(+) diphosphatase [Gammaproteobacteria bacterium]|jgi:NAD+ diphosphatase|nr:MAG: NAD(+) diphosphatase [Gammaproteobacteria bacterium]
MIPVNNNLVFTPENINTSSESGISIILRNQEFLTSKTSEFLLFEEDDLKWSEMEMVNKQFLGYLNNKPCFLSELTNESKLDEDLLLTPLRNLLGRIPDSLFTICSRSLQLSEWTNNNQFCGSCGSKMNKHETERAMFCECNNLLVYPRISPCIIVLVTKGEQLLLAHNKNFPGTFYSTLAGFIEAGESAESAIHREIYEEVKVNVKNIQYFGSQSWPFPSQLMLGFHAEYLDGDITPDGEEIDLADWFHYRELPQVPTGNISISGQLIESYIEKLKS